MAGILKGGVSILGLDEGGVGILTESKFEQVHGERRRLVFERVFRRRRGLVLHVWRQLRRDAAVVAAFTRLCRERVSDGGKGVGRCRGSHEGRHWSLCWDWLISAGEFVDSPAISLPLYAIRRAESNWEGKSGNSQMRQVH